MRLSVKEGMYLKDMAQNVRKQILEMCHATGTGHIGSSFSTVDILTALYFGIMRMDGALEDGQEPDRLVLSKGHACAALYACLAKTGRMPKDVLNGFAKDGGTLEQHPTRCKEYGIDVSSGSLGHGLSIGAGMALAARCDEKRRRVFVVLSDGETNEGSTWEAVLFAAQHGLENLVAIVDYNKMQAMGNTRDIISLDPFLQKWAAMGWGVREVDGHDFDQLVPALREAPFEVGKPSVIIAHTVKGKGVCFMEGDLLWHYRCPDSAEYEKAVCELC